MSQELKTTIEALGRAFEDFKAKNDERLKQIAEQGAADASLVEGVEKANAAIGELQAQVRSLETQTARVADAAGGGVERGENERQHAARFFSAARRRTVAAEDVSVADLASYRAYRGAFDAMLRSGPTAPAAEIRAALSVGSDPSGGYLVPGDVTGRIVELLYETSPLRQYASVETTSRDAKEGFNDLAEAGFGWVGEKQSRPETTTPDLGKWRIPVREMYASPKTTQQELDDAEWNVEEWLAKKVADRFSRAENAGGVNGNGALQMRGFLTYASGVPSATTFNVIERIKTGVNGAFAASNPADLFLNVIGKMKRGYLNGAAWAMNRTTEAESRKLKDAQGNYLLIVDFAAGAKSTILGYPVAPFEDMPAIATGALSIAFAQWKEAYTLLDRLGIRTLRDPFTDKPNILFYTTKRVGGDVSNFEAIKLVEFSA